MKLLTTFSTSILSLRQTETIQKKREIMFGSTCQEEVLRTDAFKFRKKGAKLEVCLCIYFLGFIFLLLKKGTRKEREREKKIAAA